MSDETKLLSFIESYKYAESEYSVDWIKVSENYDGIFFTNVDMVPYYFQKYNHYDGCWINSINVDSLCIWNPVALGEW